MVDPLSFHYRTSGALHNTGEAEIEPPRTRIAVAVSRPIRSCSALRGSDVCLVQQVSPQEDKVFWQHGGCLL